MPARDIAGDIWLCFLFIHCHSRRLFCVTILSYVLGSGRVTSDEIFAAICMYMLLGYGWTLFTRFFLSCSQDRCRYQRIRPERLRRPDVAASIFQLHDPDYRRVRRHRSALTGGTNHGNSRSGHGAVLSCGPGRTSGWFAHRARERSTLTRLIVSPRKPTSGLKSRL